MSREVCITSSDGIHYERCNDGGQYATPFNFIVSEEEAEKLIPSPDEATESDYIDALNDLGVDIET